MHYYRVNNMVLFTRNDGQLIFDFIINSLPIFE